MDTNFLIIKNFIPQEKCDEMVARLDLWNSKGYNLPPDDLCPNSKSFYGIFNDELLEFLPRIENTINKKLFPTYAYSRIYSCREILLPHRDRIACEYSITLTLKYDRFTWPIYLALGDSFQEVFLEVGDILIYKGVEQQHWRTPLPTNYQYQAFFHYVDQNGKYAGQKYDKRDLLATTQESLDELLRKRNVLQ